MKLIRRMRDLPGVALHDVPRYLAALAKSGPGRCSNPKGWISLCNRIERLAEATDDPGVVCDWTWGSSLHATELLPTLGRLLMSAALSEWPIEFANKPAVLADKPKLSFVFAHAGGDRLPQLVRTIRSIFAQREVACECVVVDQSNTPVLAQLPQPVVYRHLSKGGIPAGWHKSWAYNIGARLSQGSIIVFHDGDICAPIRYAYEVAQAIERRGHDVASLQRFLFYLTPTATGLTETLDRIAPKATPACIFQNWKGGTIAVAREAFFALGGFDEGFVDWGGEDDEFYDRCTTLDHCRAGYIPFVHLWHQPQAKRASSDNRNIAAVLPSRLGIVRAGRVAELVERRWGNALAPDPLYRY